MSLKFCEKCKNILFLKEIDIDSKRTLVYYCKKCETQCVCYKLRVEHKEYRTNTCIDTSYLNKYKISDPTLQTKKSKCPKCKKINKNPFEVMYLNNSYKVKSICVKCHHDWF